MGDELERASGYFNRPFEWKDMKTNASWIAQFHSLDDPLVPISQARHVHKELNTEYTELTSSGHFQDDEFPELLQFIKAKLLDK